jgi:hypothetical protein
MRKKGGDYMGTNLSAVVTALGAKATETAGQIIDVVLAALVISYSCVQDCQMSAFY